MKEKHRVKLSKLKPKLPLSTPITGCRVSSDRRGRYGQICARLSVIPWHNSLTSNRGMFSENRDDEKKKMGKEHRRCQDATVKTALLRNFLLPLPISAPRRLTENIQRGNQGFSDLFWLPVMREILYFYFFYWGLYPKMEKKNRY